MWEKRKTQRRNPQESGQKSHYALRAQLCCCDERQPEVDVSCSWAVVSPKSSSESSLRENTLNSTNVVASRQFVKENASLPVDVRRSKTLLLKLPCGSRLT